ncbi:hypothetical protein chiPu_0026051 [Chiloscyllium punctatum]|uniref:Uncharacterized protein n=1 Tax=Chiloscyllium punctatum TaxID=137246 RepID=A0A401TIJ0_CHIPU|nr:hypothetical protein [Chiloscyllium punctatum]
MGVESGLKRSRSSGIEGPGKSLPLEQCSGPGLRVPLAGRHGARSRGQARVPERGRSRSSVTPSRRIQCNSYRSLQ